MKIELTADEESLAEKLEFDPGKVRDHEDWKRNSELAAQLAHSILKRKAVPDHRLRYFTDPDYHPGGRNKSRRDNWVANGNSYEDILRHNNFLPYLRYFIHGPNIPKRIIDEFRQAVLDCGQVSSGDMPELTKMARRLWRESGRIYDANTFYQMALECGLNNFRAPSIHSAIRQAR
ncbi:MULTISPECIES: hypothetical protein [unclassified Mesorhizobium]|uniref:hypothetical protein n=1 Tax=unclassified Mesorhizobium TaxID=325217 RepID=UPI001091F420|nr:MULTISPECIES: hypothetical protein [unclassified Mesorhizobium]TGP88919.1 hypothetical protein EN861_27045 [Mesorhizobium sp. M8A.F.Ca.ET.218.01.1.1]TGT16079.1 hypothetical protein EN856_26580 [Mesorhizobium sp. M8A.F.Ca.ET.213.01.1.1]